VPAKPLRANNGTAASTIAWRRSSLSSREWAMAQESKRSLTVGQETGCWPKKLGGLPPKAAQSAVWCRPALPPVRPAAHHTQGKRRHIARRRNREIADQQDYPRENAVAPVVGAMIPSLMHIPKLPLRRGMDQGGRRGLGWGEDSRARPTCPTSPSPPLYGGSRPSPLKGLKGRRAITRYSGANP
jgi:hypothetical protein